MDVDIPCLLAVQASKPLPDERKPVTVAWSWSWATEDGTNITELAEPGAADALADAKEALTAAKEALTAAKEALTAAKAASVAAARVAARNSWDRPEGAIWDEPKSAKGKAALEKAGIRSSEPELVVGVADKAAEQLLFEDGDVIVWLERRQLKLQETKKAGQPK